MAATSRRKSSTLELGPATRQNLNYVTKHSDTVVSLVATIRAMAKKYRELLQIQEQVEKGKGTLTLQVRSAQGEIVQELSMDFKL